MDNAQKFDQFRLTNTPWDSIITSIAAVQIDPKFTQSTEFCTFITIRKGGEGTYIFYYYLQYMYYSMCFF